MDALLNAVKTRIQYCSFREEREFLHALKKLIEQGTSKGTIENWLCEIQARLCGPSFSSVYNTCTALLDEFFPEDNVNPFALPISNECENENIATL